MTISNRDIALLIGYAVVCIGIGFWSSRKQKDDDYMIAGRKMTLFGFMSSVVASYIGGAAIVAYTAYVYQFGISAIAVFVGTSAGFMVFIPYALKLRKYSSKKEFHTLADWFYFKFGKKAGFLSASILFIAYLGMLLNQFIAGSTILAYISGWSYEMSLLFASVIISLYLFVGGFKSVIKTDIFQYIVLFVLFIFLAVLLTGEERRGQAIEFFDMGHMNIPMAIVFIAFGIFIVFQSAEYWQRVYGAKNNKVVKRGFIGSAILVVITGIAITLIGLAAYHKVPGLEAKNAFSEGLKILLPPEYLGAGLVLIFAAIMSSADTQIFVLASSASKDFISNILKKELTQNQLKKATRIFIVLFSLLAYILAYMFRDLVTVIVFITGIGFTIIPAAIASFHFKLKKESVIASFAGGLIYIIVIIIMGKLIPEYAIFSIVVAALVLVFSQILINKMNLFNIDKNDSA